MKPGKFDPETKVAAVLEVPKGESRVSGEGVLASAYAVTCSGISEANRVVAGIDGIPPGPGSRKRSPPVLSAAAAQPKGSPSGRTPRGALLTQDKRSGETRTLNFPPKNVSTSGEHYNALRNVEMKNELTCLATIDSRKDQSRNHGTSAPACVKPQITSYTSERLMEQIGPALSCSGTPCGVT
jgi:hypothetical protein